MRTLVLYSQEGRVPGLAKVVAHELGKAGHQVQLMEAEPSGSSPISCGRYDLVVVGSPVQGVFGGKVASDMDLAIKRCTRLEGKTCAAFVQPGMFGTTKALRYLMSLLERHGALVRDFATVSSETEAKKFAHALSKLTP